MTDKPKVFPVILAGGSGKRLWPVSTPQQPKQFLPLTESLSLFQQTCQRASQLCDELIIMTSEAYRFIVAEQLRVIGVLTAHIMLEPEPKNTAAAIMCAALKVQELAPDSLMVVLPSDHHIGDQEAWVGAMHQAIAIAQEGYHVVFGLEADAPSTQYGYIDKGDAMGVSPSAFHVRGFTEKPDMATAQRYIELGHYLWNSGMFMFQSHRLIHELQTIDPHQMQACTKAYQKALKDMDFLRLDKESYGQCAAVSIDVALMEKTRNAAVIQVQMGWSDIGSYQALERVYASDMPLENGQGFSEETQNFVYSPHKQTYVVGIENVRVITTDEATIVMHRDVAQVPQAIMDQFHQSRALDSNTQKQYRPWGAFRMLFSDDGVKVKRLTINPKARISLQEHHKRSEHWVVIEGGARITIGDQVRDVQISESVFVPKGCKHRIENIGDTPLIIIEIQSGELLDEADIIRYDDDYGRHHLN